MKNKRSLHSKKSIKKYICSFVDEQVRTALEAFLNKTNTYYAGKFLLDIFIVERIIISISTSLSVSEITWEWFQGIFDQFEQENEKMGVCVLFSRLINNDCYNGIYAEIVNSFADVTHIASDLFWLFKNKLFPLNIICVKSKQAKNSMLSFKVDINCLFLHQMLSQFINSHFIVSKKNRSFFMDFEQSLDNNTINHITDFNIATFDKQYWFYKDSWEKRERTHRGNDYVNLLKSFYLMLLNKPDGHAIFTWQDGIDQYMLQNFKFGEQYEKGFKLVPLNSLDPIPPYDKWLLIPNGIENKSTKLNNHQYIPIDFSTVKNDVMKHVLKHWFWNEKTALSGRIDKAHVCIHFLNFVIDYRMRSIIKIPENEYVFTTEEIFSYAVFIKSQNSTQHNVVLVKNFLKYIQRNNLYKVAPAAYQYLIPRRVVTINNAKDIPDKELILLEAKLHANSEGNYLNTLYYIAFHIAISTECRISQILNLKIDCICTGLKNEYQIRTNTKVTKGEEIKIYITPYTKRFIETAIKYTQEVRDLCTDNKLKEHIFLHNYFANKYKVAITRTFSSYLKRVSLQIGLMQYSAQNLRDTYMTKAIEFAIKNNIPLIELKSLTSHKKFDTTNNHYVAQKIRDYLEAMHMIKIGNIQVKGKISAEKSEDFSNKNLVNENCGYCSKEACDVENGLGCLMCTDGFIATLDNIPFYNVMINKINNKIKLSNLTHDKEHYLAIKMLYIAYLERLLILKEEKELRKNDK